ncbi:MAG: hypothetical protein PHG27_02600 [Massilibacteroides sp.]|nr:hypothetical protein [Massilibacteroides sp.]MDD3062349.1 hypothetical protein [Massilibacteroides sp.]MDD4114475.1 hypothetical protein [Massilibacteroides sp.]MDD4660756.1 hypothetical protein [Massilibacteroides sp.]
MAGISFFKTRKPRKFEHKPIYWDPEKEKKEERERRIKRELGLDDLSEYKPSIKGTFVEGTSHLKKSLNKGDTVESRKVKSFRLIMILLFLGLLAWFLFWR